ncbi:phospholipid scramblase 1-like [Mytilus galloprovincialis]|uniref:phospholipid scramblase 1-like n=1 Tax=Mytilus edulis TaxID=6550 RepID=UPI0039EF8585
MNQQKVHPGQDGSQPPAYTNQQQPYTNQQQPYTNQPPALPPGLPQANQQQWMPAVGASAGCPSGLEYLTQIDSVIIKQQVDLIEAFVGWEQANKYQITNNQNQQIYFAAEESSMLQRQCCGPSRGFTIHITDNMNQEVLRLVRDFKMFAGCCWCATGSCNCCAHEVRVEAPIGHVIGYVRQEQSCWAPRFTIKDADHNDILKINGPCCVLSMPCCEDVFMLKNAEETADLGKISKKPGMAEIFTDANTFGANFPMNLDVKAKACVLGAVFLIDFMFFEGAGNKMMSYN